ncbi:hypothetical protein KEM48_009908 [Puccinia striiformis f. sp. tritici PST-130]|nr:hypothetical protein KEM48_009908 [Puccinia striiformis f. sp. tritici PST-130]
MILISSTHSSRLAISDRLSGELTLFQLDGIVKNILANQEAKLDQLINFNQSLNEYRAAKKMEAIARRDSIYKFMIHLTLELLKDPGPTLHSQDSDAVYFKKKFGKLEKTLANDKTNPLHKENLATFNIRFEQYQEALVQAQEIKVQATQTKDKTVIPTTKVLKIESRPAPTEKPIPEVTGNVHLDKHLAKKTITEKPVGKTVDKPIKKKLLPLESTIGDSSISSFTTEPYFKDLEPTTSLPSPFLKKIALKKELPVISDLESEVDIGNLKEPTDHSSSPVLEKIALKKALPILSDSEDKIDKAKQAQRTDQVPQALEGNNQTPRSLGIIRKPRLLNASQASNKTESETESESEDEIQEVDIIKILIKKHVKIHTAYLKAIVDEDMKRILDLVQQSQLILQKLIPNKEIESYVSGWNPWIKKKKVFPTPHKNKKRLKSDKRNQPRQSRSNRPDQNHSNNRSQARLTHSRNQARLDTRRSQGRSNNNQRQTHSNNQSSNKRPREESEDLEDAVNNPSSSQSKIYSSLSTINHNITALESNYDVNTNKILRTVEKYNLKCAKTSSEISDQLSDPLPVQMGPLEKSLVSHLKKEIDKQNNESISDVIASLRIEIKSLTDIASVLSQTPTPDNSADIIEKLEQSEASILSNVKQDLITEVRVTRGV